MYWNHRVVKTTEHGETLFAVMEVHYNDDNSLMGYTEPFLHDETIEGLTEVHARMTAALALPVLNAEDFPTYNNNNNNKPEPTIEDVVCVDHFYATDDEKAAAAAMLATLFNKKD